MAVVSVSSTVITNRDAVPRVKTISRVIKMAMQMASGTVELAAGDSIASKLKFAQVPSNARISQVLLSCDALTAGAMDIGIYQTTDNGGAVVDADHFASAADMATALKNSDVTFESGVYGVEDLEKPLWEALGLATDPMRDYDIVGTLTTAATAAGTVSLQVSYGI